MGYDVNELIQTLKQVEEQAKSNAEVAGRMGSFSIDLVQRQRRIEEHACILRHELAASNGIVLED